MLAGAPILTGSVTGNGTSTTLAATLGPTLAAIVPDQGGGVLDARQVTLAIANSSGQTITAATLTLSDVVGGLPVTLTYTVPIAAAGLATGAAAPYTIPLTSGLLPTVGVSLVFASAPASGATVGLKATVQTAGAPAMSLVGSIAPNATNSLGKVLSIPYTDLTTASTTYYYYYTGLHPNAKLRLVIEGPDSAGGWNASPIPYCTVGVFVWNNSLIPVNSGQIGDAAHVRAPSFNSVANIAGGYAAQWDSLTTPQIGAPGDTLVVSVATGTSLPTSGQDNVWVLEVL